MRNGNKLLLFGLCGVMTAAAPMSALAASPRFSRTEAEWARLEDNTLEYGELAGLIHEYNVTVQTNQLSYSDFINEYGRTNTDVSSKYRELAEEIYSSLDYPDTSEVTYGYMVPSVLQAQLSADSMMKQADETLEDADISWLTYQQAEATLVTVAQTNLITYQQNQLELEQAEYAKTLAELAYQSAVTKQSEGMSTLAEVLSAQESLQNAQRTIDSTKASMENVRQKLLVMLGWKYSDNPEILPVPAVDMTRLASINPEADIAQALENNYTLKINKKKLENAADSSTKESLSKTIADNEQRISASVTANYQNVLSAQLAYEKAAAEAQLAVIDLQTAQRSLANGTISPNAYQQQESQTASSQAALKIAELSLMQTIETYDWGLKGLANASAS